MKLPDGLLLLVNPKRTEIELKETPFIMCKNCKYFGVKEHIWTSDEDVIIATAYMPTCTRWQSTTKEDGWCYLAEPKEDEKGAS